MKTNKKLSLIIFACIVIASAVFAAVFAKSADGARASAYSVGIIESSGFKVESENPVSVKKGEDAVFCVTLDENYYFADLAGGKYEDGTLTFASVTSEQSIKIRARSYDDPPKLITNISGCGKVESANGKSEFALGEKVSLVFIPDEHYLLSSVKINGKTYPLPDGALEVEANDDIDVYAVFAGEETALSVLSSSRLGNAVILTPKSVFRYGDRITLSAQYDEETINFLGWSEGKPLGDREKPAYSNAEITITLSGDLVMYANFASQASASVRYDKNGGSCSSLPAEKKYGEGEEVGIVIDDGAFSREGYRLVGFNEKSDLSGTEHSLGGAFPMGRSDITLFAHWEKETAPDMLSYSSKNGEITITGLSRKGKNEKISSLIIPSEIEGLPVRAIADKAFAYEASLETVVLPKDLLTIGERAFAQCTKIKRVYFPETLTALDKSAFLGCSAFTEMRVIPTSARVFDIDYSSGMADRFMTLKATKGKKRIIFVGGSNLTMGLDSAAVDTAFPEYDVINFSNAAHYGSLILMEMLRENVSEGDIIVFSLEYGKALYGGAQPTKFANWNYIESNYEILHEVNIQNVSGLLNTYVDYLDSKRGFLEKGEKMYRSVVYSRSSLNRYGDDIAFRAQKGPADTNLPPLSILTKNGMEIINDFCREMNGIGVRTLFSFPCINIPEDTTDSKLRDSCDAFLNKFTSLADGSCITVISDPYDYYYDGAYCYDSEYHLSSELVPWRTNLLISDLQKFFEKEGK